MMLYDEGEYGAFEELYFRHSGRVYGFLRNRLHLPGEAEDLLQSVFMKLHQSRNVYDGTLPFLPWIFAIARNVLIDHMRKRKAIPVESEKVIALADKRTAENPSIEGAVNWDEILRLLPQEQRDLLVLRFEEGLSFEEIAMRCGGNGVSARKRISRTIQNVRKALLGQRKGAKS